MLLFKIDEFGAQLVSAVTGDVEHDLLAVGGDNQKADERNRAKVHCRCERNRSEDCPVVNEDCEI